MSVNTRSEIDALSATFAALSDPTRRAMLARLSQGEAWVNELAAPFKMSLPAVSKHIKVLQKAGLLIKTVSAQQRACKIDGVQLKQAVDWIDQYKHLWEARFDRLDTYLVELQAIENAAKDEPKAKKSEKSINQNAIKSIATKAINTLDNGENRTKKQILVVLAPRKPKKTKSIEPNSSSTSITPKKEHTHDNDTITDLQQQIGFDF
jgi:DNA-binding transcriptional ArsR family regulator